MTDLSNNTVNMKNGTNNLFLNVSMDDVFCIYETIYIAHKYK